MYSRSKKKKKNATLLLILIKTVLEITGMLLFFTNYRREMKLVPIDMDHRLLQFDVLKSVLGVRLYGGPVPNFILNAKFDY